MIKKTLKLSACPPHSIRLDSLLAEHCTDYSRRKIRSLIHQGGVYVNRKRIRKQGYMLQGKKSVHLQLIDYDGTDVENLAAKINWKDHILHRTDHWSAINKPIGISTSPTRHSVLHNLYAYLQKEDLIPPTALPGNRHDRETSGEVIIPLTNRFAAHFNDQLANRKILKRYLAVSSGIAEQHSWKTEGFMSRSSGTRMRFYAKESSRSRYTLSQFKLVSVNKERNLSLIEAKPLTGRTHQLRVHLKHDGLPIIGDSLYGNKISSSITVSRMMLHCAAMEFVDTSGKMIQVEASVPSEMTELFPYAKVL